MNESPTAEHQYITKCPRNWFKKEILEHTARKGELKNIVKQASEIHK